MEQDSFISELITFITELDTSVRELGISVRELDTSVRELDTSARELGISVRELGISAALEPKTPRQASPTTMKNPIYSSLLPFSATRLQDFESMWPFAEH